MGRYNDVRETREGFFDTSVLFIIKDIHCCPLKVVDSNE